VAYVDHALAFAARGLRVFPLHALRNGACVCKMGTDCAAPGKHPGITGWVTRATTNEGDIRQWWSERPDCGIAIATGQASNLLVLDIDAKPGWPADDTLADLEERFGELPATAHVLSGGGGLQYYFTWPNLGEGQAIRSRSGLFQFVDIRGEGGQVVAPPSPHRSGRAYQWEVSSTALAEAPDWLVLACLAAEKPTAHAGGGPVAVADRLKDGERNEMLFKLASSLRAKGMDVAEILPALVAVNDRRCKPPKGLAELEKIANSVGKYAAGPSDEYRRPPVVEPADAGLGAPLARDSDVELAHRVLDDLQRGRPQPVVYDEGSLYRYEAPCWRPITQSEAVRATSEYDGHWYVAGYKENKDTGERTPVLKRLRLGAGKVDGAVKLARHFADQPGFFSGAPVGLATDNGFVDVSKDGLRLRPPTPEQRCRARVPITFDPDAPHARWTQFLAEVFRDDEDRDDKAKVLQEFAGACLTGIPTRYAKCLVLHGSGANGKSVALTVMSALFVPQHRCSITPHDLSQDFKLSVLIGKRINICNETPNADIASSERFKAVLDGNEVTAREPYRPAVTFKPRCGHVFACNDLPGTRDHSDGYWRRINALKFARQFSPDEQDATLADNIIASELAGVARWALEGAVRMLRNGGYTEPAGSVEDLAQWRLESDQVRQWVAECTVAAERGQWVKSTRLYDAYRDWAKASGLRQVSITKFGRRLGQIVQRERLECGVHYSVRLRAVRM